MRRAATVAVAAATLPVLLALHPAERRPLGQGALAAGACELRLADRARTPSAHCVACHDGSTALGTPLKRHPDGGAGHPVEVDYLRAFARRPGLHPPAALPADLPLVDGKVSCTTCHDARSSERGKPAVTTRYAALCLACHAK
jgi:predicted CXXCH cytochrome family protein